MTDDVPESEQSIVFETDIGPVIDENFPKLIEAVRATTNETLVQKVPTPNGTIVVRWVVPREGPVWIQSVSVTGSAETIRHNLVQKRPTVANYRWVAMRYWIALAVCGVGAFAASATDRTWLFTLGCALAVLLVVATSFRWGPKTWVEPSEDDGMFAPLLLATAHAARLSRSQDPEVERVIRDKVLPELPRLWRELAAVEQVNVTELQELDGAVAALIHRDVAFREQLRAPEPTPQQLEGISTWRQIRQAGEPQETYRPQEWAPTREPEH